MAGRRCRFCEIKEDSSIAMILEDSAKATKLAIVAAECSPTRMKQASVFYILHRAILLFQYLVNSMVQLDYSLLVILPVILQSADV